MTAPQGNRTTVSGQIITVSELLANSSLKIPFYQRPYKWTGQNISQLLSDITTHSEKSAWRLGSIVLHLDEYGNNNIVDGQQRTLSLLLCVQALLQKKGLSNKTLKEQLHTLARQMIIPEFSDLISQNNIRQNYLTVSRIISRPDFTEEHALFLLNKCEVVVVTLNNLSEAFQFFDSQNARGRDLAPHDLLKAFHLREFSLSDEKKKKEAVEKWEAIAPEKLAKLFSDYLFRIRKWSANSRARYFSKQDIDLFKGININTVARYPYTRQLHITHQFVDHYNAQYERHIDEQTLHFPFQIDQKIINGRRFFDFVSHYQQQIVQCDLLFKGSGAPAPDIKLTGYAGAIIQAINTYEGQYRKGDRYVRALFDCLLIFYMDKFGHAEIASAIERIFIWAYSLRLKHYAIQVAGMDNYVLAHNLFRILKDATTPADFLCVTLPVVHTIKSSKINKIEALFREMEYYAE